MSSSSAESSEILWAIPPFALAALAILLSRYISQLTWQRRYTSYYKGVRNELKTTENLESATLWAVSVSYFPTTWILSVLGIIWLFRSGINGALAYAVAAFAALVPLAYLGWMHRRVEDLHAFSKMKNIPLLKITHGQALLLSVNITAIIVIVIVYLVRR